MPRKGYLAGKQIPTYSLWYSNKRTWLFKMRSKANIDTFHRPYKNIIGPCEDPYATDERHKVKTQIIKPWMPMWKTLVKIPYRNSHGDWACRMDILQLNIWHQCVEATTETKQLIWQR